MLALLLALGQIAAGALDFMENRYLLEILDVHPGDYGSRPYWAAGCAYAKFGLLLSGVLCGLLAPGRVGGEVVGDSSSNHVGETCRRKSGRRRSITL